MEIRTRTHSVFLLVGPEKCGKTYFATNKLIPKIKEVYKNTNYTPNIKYLSSEDSKKEFLNEDNKINIYDLQNTIKLGDELLLNKLDYLTQFPINTDFVVIDGNGLSQNFRKEVIDICKKNHYNLEIIVFNFLKDFHFKKYNNNFNEKTQMKIIELRNNIIPSLNKIDYKAIHRVKFIDDYLNVSINNLKYYLETILPNDNTYIAIGDVHESIDELKELIVKFNYKIDVEDNILLPKNTYIILMGDFINKGKKTKETIDFIYQNLDKFLIIKGNHEEMVEKLLKKSFDENEKIISSHPNKNYFKSYNFLRNNSDYKNKFLKIIEKSVSFYQILSSSENKAFYFTHSPCYIKYLGKITYKATREQRSLSFNKKLNPENKYDFLFENSNKFYPYHIFGHFAFEKMYKNKNMIGLDTGCIHGNKLTGVKITNNKLEFKSVDFLHKQKIQEKKLMNLFKNN